MQSAPSNHGEDSSLATQLDEYSLVAHAHATTPEKDDPRSRLVGVFNHLLLASMATGVSVCSLVALPLDAEAGVTSLGGYLPLSLSSSVAQDKLAVKSNIHISMIWRNDKSTYAYFRNTNKLTYAYLQMTSYSKTIRFPPLSATIDKGAMLPFHSRGRFNLPTGDRYLALRIGDSSQKYGWLRYHKDGPGYSIVEGYYNDTNGATIYVGQKVDSPTTNASNLTSSIASATSITLNWTNGDGANRIVLAQPVGEGSVAPTINTTYAANAAYGTGDTLGQLAFVVYNGTGNTVTVTGLNTDTPYQFTVIEYNGTAGSEFYYISKFGGAPLASGSLTPTQTGINMAPINMLLLSENDGAAPKQEQTGSIPPEGNLGLLAFGARGLEAMREVREATDYELNHEIVPDMAAMERDRVDTALRHALQSVKQDPTSIEAHELLANTYFQIGNVDKARQAAQKLLELDASSVDGHLTLARVYDKMGQRESALDHARTAFDLRPDAETHMQLGMVHKSMGNTQEAITHLRETVRLSEDEQSNAKWFLAMLEGKPVPDAIRNQYVEGLFDNYAGKYDRHLVQGLKYRGPQHIAKMLEGRIEPNRQSRILDLGCGTGLCGKVLRPMASKLVGVDISGQMLAHAKTTGVYDSLNQQEIHEFLETSTDKYDLVTSSDVLVYMGELERLFKATRNSLRNNGLFAFTVESSEDGTFALNPSGRYSHSEQYLRETAAAAGFEVLDLHRAQVRREHKEPVPSFAVTLKAV